MRRVGILTFHCADNYGAMLQAYALINFLRKKNVDAEIIRYEPPFMTGRHWWIPYKPLGDGLLGIFRRGWWGWQGNLRQGKVFFQRKARIRQFRKKYLISKGRRKLFFSSQLKRLPYQYYIVGSDQIWNPEITLGFREAYFGAFKNRNKKKVIAYAASLGGESLAPEYDAEFSKLLKTVDCISVRESAAVPYVKKCYEGGEVVSVLDPVFLLTKEEWMNVEYMLDKKRFLFVYMTEKNDCLVDYAKKLSERKGLDIIQIKGGTEITGKNVWLDRTAGPKEFLSYIHQADYVVTNSFHGIAFSIIYQKKFVAFPHSSRGARISNILEICDLENRLYGKNRDLKIDDCIEWDSVKRKVEKNVRLATGFLEKSLGVQDVRTRL